MQQAAKENKMNTNSGKDKVLDSLGLLPPKSPPIEPDLFVASAYTIEKGQTTGTIAATLEAQIHTMPEKLKRYLVQNFQREENKESKRQGEAAGYRINQTVRTVTVSRRSVTGGGKSIDTETEWR